MPETLGPLQREVLEQLVRALADVPGVAAVTLGGSHARGTARVDSDVDVGLYYREASPFDLGAIRRVATRVHEGAPPVVTDFYAWGPWVNGGVWLRTRAGRFDLIYRNLDQLDRVIRDARAGRSEWHYAQTPIYGFHGVCYLAETQVGVALHDPDDLLAARKREIAAYPEALKANLVQQNLWGAEFALRFFLRGCAERGDVYNAVGCMTRIASHLSQALFALNETYFMNDKSALDEIEGFALGPEAYAASIRAILAHPGETPSSLLGTTSRLEGLFAAVGALAGDAYRPPYPAP